MSWCELKLLLFNVDLRYPLVNNLILNVYYI